ncbi:MAG: arylesterase [Bdellovibrionota bacterium]
MFKYLTFFKIIPLLFLLAPISSFAENKMVVLGDSLTEGYGVSKDSAFPALLEKKISSVGKSWIVVNAGVTGSTTASGPGRLKWILNNKDLSSQPKIILIILGANDGLRGLKAEDSQKNLSKTIELIQAKKIKVVLGGIYMPPNYGKDYTEKFKKIYSELAQKYKIKLIPFILDKVGGNAKYNLADGIHPNEEGHKIIAENIYESIKDIL